MARKGKVTQMQQLPVTHFTQLIWAMIGFWATHTVILFFGNLLFPYELVLGTELVSPFMSALYAGGVTAMIAVSAIPIIEFLAVQMRMKLSGMHWMALYLVLNVGGVWFVSRFAELIGMGIRYWWVAVVVGLMFDIVQGIIMKSFVSKR